VGVKGPGDQVEAFDRRLLGREVAAGFDRPPVAGVQRLDRIGRADHRADLDVVIEEGDELVQRFLPQPDHSAVALTTFPI
jgi:hypothetical protein